jgi:hypothetical protein
MIEAGDDPDRSEWLNLWKLGRQEPFEGMAVGVAAFDSMACFCGELGYLAQV